MEFTNSSLYSYTYLLCTFKKKCIFFCINCLIFDYFLYIFYSYFLAITEFKFRLVNSLKTGIYFYT